MKNFPGGEEFSYTYYSKTCLKRPLKKRPKTGFKAGLLLHAGQKYCRILLTFINLPFVKTFVLSIFEWPLKTGCTVCPFQDTRSVYS